MLQKKLIQKEIKKIEVIEMEEYQDIIQTFGRWYKFTNYNLLQKLLLKLKQNTHNIVSKIQSNYKEINDYKNILEKAKAENLFSNFKR